MSGLRQVFEIARRDFLQRARSKAFLITSLVTIGAIFGLIPLFAQEVSDPPPVKVGVLASVDESFESRLNPVAEALGFDVEVETFEALPAAEQALVADGVEVVVAPGEIVFARESNSRLSAAASAAHQAIERDRLVAELGLDPEIVVELVSPAPLPERLIDPLDPEDLPRRVGTQVGSIILYIAILMFGQFIMMGVMEEKQSRVVEVVLSRAKAERLLTGKVLGIGLLGLLQLAVIGGSLVAALNLVEIPGLDMGGLGWKILVQTVLWFLLGFGLYSVLYGGLGATVTRQEDAQGMAFLPVLLLLPGYFISFIAIEEPNALAPVIASFVPFSAPLVMPVRIATGTVPAWQVAAAVAIVVVTTVIVIRLGARIYRGAVLSIGAKVKLRDALRGETG
ncbi:MAG: ABC transporter permease [Acidimicrobiia bacterium]|nr:ABC transporter permease [Acidimicrobiia bacterium]